MIRNPFAAKIGRRLHTSTARAVTLGSAAVLALGLTASLGPASASPQLRRLKPVVHKHTATHPRDFDLRSNGAALARSDARLRVSPRPGVSSLRKALGPQGVISLDPLTGTPRTVSRLDGFLTGPSGTHSLPGGARLRARRTPTSSGSPAPTSRVCSCARATPTSPASVTSAGPSRSAACPCSATDSRATSPVTAG